MGLTSTLKPPSQERPSTDQASISGNAPPVLTTGIRSVVVAMGFATTVAMWAIGYACMTQPGLVLGEALFAMELAALAFGGYVAGRVLGSVRAGTWVGVVSATVNLLIVGSLFRRGEDGSIIVSAITWIVGLYLVSIVLCTLGAVFGSRAATAKQLPMATGLFSIIAAITVFLLLITGGLVTGLEAGLAVPDWPNSFGHNMLLYPLSEMTGGVYYEHAHRLYGMLVGLTALSLLVMVFIHDRRIWLRTLVIVVFLMVCAQGVMGGLRVTGEFTMSQENTAPSLTLAIVHGVFGQIVFAGFCWLAVASIRTWRNVSSPAESSHGEANRFCTIALVVALFIQLLLGAFYRHLQVPATAETPAHHPMWALVGHLSFSVVVVLLSVYAGVRMLKFPSNPLERTLGQAVIVLVAFQFLLGIAAFTAVILRPESVIPTWELISTSAHQANGALLLGTAVALAALVHHSQTSARDPQSKLA